MGSLAIEAVNVSKRFGDITALNGVNFSIPSGAVFGLLGPNGAGKTTAVRILNAAIESTGFQKIFILGFDIKKNIQDIRQFVGVQTDTNLYERLSALDNLRMFGKLYGLPDSEVSQRCDMLLGRSVSRSAPMIKSRLTAKA